MIQVFYKKVYVLGLICFISYQCEAQAPDTLWTRILDISGEDYAHCVQQTSDGGFIITGRTRPHPGIGKIFLLKTGNHGNTEWVSKLGGDHWGTGHGVLQTADGGFIVSGDIRFDDERKRDACLITTGTGGKELWLKTYGESDESFSRSLERTSDGGYIIAGRISSRETSNDFYLVKTDEYGNELWTRIFGGKPHEEAYAVRQTSDGGYIITGTSHTGCDMSYSSDVYLVKTDKDGYEMWSGTYGDDGNQSGLDIVQTAEEGYIIIGHVMIFDPPGDVYLLKTDSEGNELWNRTFGGIGHDGCKSITETNDGGYIIAGGSNSNRQDYQDNDLLLIKVDNNGDELWFHYYNGGGNETGFDIQQTTDGGFVVVGSVRSYEPESRNSDIWLVRFGPEKKIYEQNR